MPVCVCNRPMLEGITRSVAPSCPRLGRLVGGVCRALSSDGNVNLTTPRVNLTVHLIIVSLSILDSSLPRCGKFHRTFVGPRVLRCSRSTRGSSSSRKYLSVPNVGRGIIHPAHVRIGCVSRRFRRRSR